MRGDLLRGPGPGGGPGPILFVSDKEECQQATYFSPKCHDTKTEKVRYLKLEIFTFRYIVIKFVI